MHALKTPFPFALGLLMETSVSALLCWDGDGRAVLHTAWGGVFISDGSAKDSCTVPAVVQCSPAHCLLGSSGECLPHSSIMLSSLPHSTIPIPEGVGSCPPYLTLWQFNLALLLLLWPAHRLPKLCHLPNHHFCLVFDYKYRVFSIQHLPACYGFSRKAFGARMADAPLCSESSENSQKDHLRIKEE